MKDHISIKIEMKVKPTEPQVTSRRFALQKLNIEKLNRLVNSSGWEDNENPLHTLQQEIQKALLECCLRAKSSS